MSAGSLWYVLRLLEYAALHNYIVTPAQTLSFGGVADLQTQLSYAYNNNILHIFSYYFVRSLTPLLHYLNSTATNAYPGTSW